MDDIDDDGPSRAAPLSRDELRARREANVEGRVQEALKFKQEVDSTYLLEVICGSWMRIQEKKRRIWTLTSASTIRI